MSQINVLGPVGFNPTGPYDVTRTYQKLDVVYYQGSSYVAISDSLGQLPTNADYWLCIAAGSLKQFIYDSVASMKVDNTLAEGMAVQTLGYYEANDGGGATYKITDIESENEYQEELDSGLYATLVVDDNTNAKQFGAYGDNTHDDTLSLQKVINYAIAKKYKLRINGKFKISETIIVDGSGFIIDGENATINYSGSGSAIKLENIDGAFFSIGTINALNGTCIELFSSTDVGWIQYLELHFNLLRSKDKCVFINRNGRWINEVRIYGGQMIEGEYGIHADANGANMNGFKIINVGVEGVQTGFYLKDNVNNWLFLGLRHAESFEKLLTTVGRVVDIIFVNASTVLDSQLELSNETSGLFISNCFTGDFQIVDRVMYIKNGCLIPQSARKYKNFGNISNPILSFNDCYNYFMVNANTQSLKLNKGYGTLTGINEIYIQFNFESNTPFILYDGNGNVIFNNTSNLGWSTLRLTWISEIGWIAEKVTKLTMTS